MSYLDHEDPHFEAFRDWSKQRYDAIPARLDEIRAELRELFAPFDAFDVLTALWMGNVPSDPETYRESDHKGLASAVELAASVLVERPDRGGSEPGRYPGHEALSPAMELMREYLADLSIWLLHDTYQAAADDDRDFAEVRGRSRGMRAAVRGVSYEWQERATVEQLFGTEQIRSDVAAATNGLGGIEALKLTDAAVEIGLDRLAERGDQARGFEALLLDELRRKRAGRPSREERLARMVEALSRLPEEVAARQAQQMALAWMAYESGVTMQFTSAELAEHAGVAMEAGQAFVDRFSTTFGAFEALERPVDLEDLRATPLLGDGEGRYVCISQHNLHWGIRPALEAAIKQVDQKTRRGAWKRYEHHRRRCVEQRAVDALTGSLSPDWSHATVEYETEVDGATVRVEVDGILRLDSALVIVEAKGASMRPSARRGARLSLESWLESELKRAAEQLARATRTFVEDPGVSVYDASGKPLELDLHGIRHVFPIAVTLEDLPAVAPVAWQLARGGVLPADTLPWIVSLHELELLCELVESPTVLVHYMRLRQRLDRQQRAWAFEELDYFGRYLASGLFFDDDAPPTQLLSHTDQFDAWFAYARGERLTPAKRPQLKHHRQVRRLLECLDGLDAPGRLDAALAILNMNGDARQRLATRLRAMRRSSAKDHRSHDLTLFFDSWGVTAMTLPPERRDELPEVLRSYCTLKKHQHRADAWVGFGGWDGPPEPAQIVFVMTDPWTPDAKLDELVAELPTAQAS